MWCVALLLLQGADLWTHIRCQSFNVSERQAAFQIGINDGAFWQLIASALLGHIGHDLLQSLQVDKFLGNVLYVVDC